MLRPAVAAILLATTSIVAGGGADEDGWPDALDNCPSVPNPDQADSETPGMFVEQSVGSMPFGSATAVGDLDGDEDLDILVGSLAEGTVRWFENAPPCLADWPVHFIPTSFPSTFYLATADIDGDGDTDVLRTDNTGVTAWLENQDGVGGSWWEHVITTEQTFIWVVAADVDGYNDLDVVVAKQLSWFENLDGTGTSWGEHPIANGDMVHADVADLDGDTDLDVVSVSIEGDAIFWHENADGTGLTWVEHAISSNVTCGRSVFPPTWTATATWTSCTARLSTCPGIAEPRPMMRPPGTRISTVSGISDRRD